MKARVRTLVVQAAAVAVLATWAAWTWLRPRPSLAPVLAHLKAGRVDEAEAQLRASLRREPGSPQGQLLLAQVLFYRIEHGDQADFALAGEALEHARKVHTQDKALAQQAKVVEGRLCDRLSRFDEVEAAWKDALVLDPASEAGGLLLRLYEFQDRRREGRALALRLHQINPKPVEKQRMLVEMIRQTVHHPSAAEIIGRLTPVVASNPREFQCTLALGRALWREGRPEEGIQGLRTMVESHSDNLDAWDALLTALEVAGQVDFLGATLALAPRRADTVDALAVHEGWLAQERGEWAGAARAYRRALVHEPQDLKLEYRLSRALRLSGAVGEAEQIERATQAHEKARLDLRQLYERHETELQGGPPRPELDQRVADLLEQMGRLDEARAWHALVLRDDPSNPLSLAAFERIK